MGQLIIQTKQFLVIIQTSKSFKNNNKENNFVLALDLDSQSIFTM